MTKQYSYEVKDGYPVVYLVLYEDSEQVAGVFHSEENARQYTTRFPFVKFNIECRCVDV